MFKESFQIEMWAAALIISQVKQKVSHKNSLKIMSIVHNENHA